MTPTAAVPRARLPGWCLTVAYPPGGVIAIGVRMAWDDEGNDRQVALDLFDAFGSKEKTLHADTGGHTGVPSFEGDAASRFFARHLG